MFVVFKKVVPLHSKTIGLWCNGNTADSGPAFPGSSPGSPTKKLRCMHRSFLFTSSIQSAQQSHLSRCIVRISLPKRLSQNIVMGYFNTEIDKQYQQEKSTCDTYRRCKIFFRQCSILYNSLLPATHTT